MSKARIVIPSNVQEVIELAEMIKTRHISDATESPLGALKDLNWSQIEPTMVTCLQQHLKAEELKRQMELAYRERDALLKPIVETVKASRDLLLGVYRTSPKKLGDWGFKVSDSPAKIVSRLKSAKTTNPAV